MAGLANSKHEQFAQGVAKGLTVERAYVYAGYSKHGAGPSGARLLRNASVRDRIEELKNAVAARVVEETGVDKAWVMRRLIENVDRCMQTTPVRDKKGGYVTTLVPGPDGDMLVMQLVSYQPRYANQALELIGKELGMFVNRLGGPSGEPLSPAPVDYSALTDEEVASLQRILGKARAS